MTITLRPETEPNDSASGANVLATCPALRTGNIDGPRALQATDASGDGSDLRRDLDYFQLPPRAIAEGTRIRLRPGPDADLRLTVYDALGMVVADSQVPGNGSMEEIVLSANTQGRTVQVDRQAQATAGAGAYRLEVSPINGIQLAPEPPLKPGPRAAGASSTGDACHLTRRPPSRAKYSNP